jgi:hypothetical protein
MSRHTPSSGAPVRPTAAVAPYRPRRDKHASSRSGAARMSQTIRRELAGRNQALMDGGDLVSFIDWCRDACGWARDNGPAGLGRTAAFDALTALTFIAGSIERAVRAAGEPADSGIAALNIDATLVAFGEACGHPPHGTAHTAWLENDPVVPFTFLGHRGERVFAQAVRLTEHHHRQSVELLAPIAAGDLEITHSAAVDAILTAAANTEEVRRGFAHLWARMDNGERHLEVLFFMAIFRQFLPAYRVAGFPRSGVNAANVPAWTEMDFTLGTVDAAYDAIADQRVQWMSDDARERVAEARSRSNVLAALYERLGVDPAEASPEAVAAALRGRTSVRAAAAACAELTQRIAVLSTLHMGLIKHYLIDPVAQMTPEECAELARLGVQPTAGTGGASHEETRRISRMRAAHPLATALRVAVKA